MDHDQIEKRIRRLVETLDIAGKKERIEQLQRQSQSPVFWHDAPAATQKMKELASLQKDVADVRQLENLFLSKSGEVEKLLARLELVLYLSGPHDRSSAILSIHAGQGGTEAMDWAAMLERMYVHFAQNRGWTVNQVEVVPGEEAGVKSVTLIVEGQYAYGYLQHEAGTHRLVRQSPFNADKLRQTSFALVEVLPQLPETETVKVSEDDLEWQFFRASSQGGQNVQKVSTAVRLTHKPTGISVTAQTERFQEQNRKIARQLLAAKLWALEQERLAQEKRDIKGDFHPASWGSQIRSYVLHPYKLVKDMRTGVETSQAQAVIDGELDAFVEEEVRLLGGVAKGAVL